MFNFKKQSKWLFQNYNAYPSSKQEWKSPCAPKQKGDKARELSGSGSWMAFVKSMSRQLDQEWGLNFAQGTGIEARIYERAKNCVHIIKTRPKKFCEQEWAAFLFLILEFGVWVPRQSHWGSRLLHEKPEHHPIACPSEGSLTFSTVHPVQTPNWNTDNKLSWGQSFRAPAAANPPEDQGSPPWKTLSSSKNLEWPNIKISYQSKSWGHWRAKSSENDSHGRQECHKARIMGIPRLGGPFESGTRAIREMLIGERKLSHSFLQGIF